MSFNAAALQMMLDKGLSLADVVEIASANEVRRDPTAAERMSRYRERKKDADETRNVTRNVDDAPPCLDKKAPQTPEKIKPIPCVRETRARLGYHRLPEGWQPTRALPPQVQAKADQWPPGTLADELAAFKRWAANAEDRNGKGRKLDWDKAWVNWIARRHDERHGRSNTLGRNQPSSDGLSSTTRAALKVFGSADAGEQHRVPQ